VPAAVGVVETNSILAVFAEPQRLLHANPDSIEPWVAGSFTSKKKDDIDFFEGAESRFGVQEVDEWDYREIRYSKDDPCAIANVGKCYRSDDNDTGSELAM
jgi:hypothetical protein